MRKFTKLLSYILSAMLVITVLYSCTEDEEVLLANLNLQVEASAAFSGLSVAGLTVELVNTVDNTSQTYTTDEQGVIVIEEIAPGTYTASCTVDLTAEEAQAASGYYQEVTLNAVVSNIVLIGDFTANKTLVLDGQPSGDLLIKEFYFSGANDPTWGILFKDQFIEIYNNSDDVIHADGLYVAGLGPFPTGQDDTDPVSTLPFDTYIYAEKIMRVPGTGEDYPIQPGESIVIAINAVDWTDDGAKADISVDLSTADFDTYAVDWLEANGRFGNVWFDTDNIDVPNMECIYIADYANFYNFMSQGASAAIFRSDNFDVEANRILDPEASANNPQYFVKIPIADVLDAVDGLNNLEAAAYKRLPVSLDAGFQYCGESYSSRSLRRKVAKVVSGRRVLQDTNNSTNDFEVIELATPRGFGN